MVLSKSYLRMRIGKLYTENKKKHKKSEQLEIGKIKFVVTPIYLNKVCIHSTFDIDFTPNRKLDLNFLNNPLPILIKIGIILIILAIVSVCLINFLENSGLWTASNHLIVDLVTPLIFSSEPSCLYPQLTILLHETGLLTM